MDSLFRDKFKPELQGEKQLLAEHIIILCDHLDLEKCKYFSRFFTLGYNPNYPFHLSHPFLVKKAFMTFYLISNHPNSQILDQI